MKAETHTKIENNAHESHGCCGGAAKQVAKETPQETGCGCGEKKAHSAPKASCCE